MSKKQKFYIADLEWVGGDGFDPGKEKFIKMIDKYDLSCSMNPMLSPNGNWQLAFVGTLDKLSIFLYEVYCSRDFTQTKEYLAMIQEV